MISHTRVHHRLGYGTGELCIVITSQWTVNKTNGFYWLLFHYLIDFTQYGFLPQPLSYPYMGLQQCMPTTQAQPTGNTNNSHRINSYTHREEVPLAKGVYLSTWYLAGCLEFKSIRSIYEYRMSTYRESGHSWPDSSGISEIQLLLSQKWPENFPCHLAQDWEKQDIVLFRCVALLGVLRVGFYTNTHTITTIKSSSIHIPHY